MYYMLLGTVSKCGGYHSVFVSQGRPLGRSTANVSPITTRREKSVQVYHNSHSISSKYILRTSQSLFILKRLCLLHDLYQYSVGGDSWFKSRTIEGNITLILKLS
ncbi:hypothetical protein Mapa_004510 [Marchantia paleacea]|nr:hypothetical protein Mapa_004510 [Marchantia paleacea]